MNQKKQLNFELISDKQIILTGSFAAFTEQVKVMLKGHGAVWVNDLKGWVMSTSSYNLIQTLIKNEASDVEIKLVPWFCFAILRELGEELVFLTHERKRYTINYSLSDQMVFIPFMDKKDVAKDIPKSLYSRLYEYQKDCVATGIRFMGRILIADEMGIGKTVQSLSLAHVYKETWPLLVICPTTLRLNWGDEIKTWLGIENIQVISKVKQVLSETAQVIIISYDLCTKFKEQLERKQFKIAIADEAHYMKNTQSQRSQVCVPILKQCKHVILLTGTPALAKPKDLYNILSVIRPDIFTNFRDFGFRYCDPKASKFTQGIDFDGASNLKELHYILSNYMMIRRLKRDVLSQLPEKRRQKVRLQCDSKIIKQIQSILGQFSTLQFETISDKLESSLSGNNDPLRQSLMKCYQLTGKAKIKSIRDFLDDLLENDLKIIFFAHHMEVLDEVEKHCQSNKVISMRIDGSIDDEQRHRNVKMFQERPDVKVAILGLTAASVGLTLTAASTIVFGEMHWTPATMLQAEDRAHRIGQKNNVDCIYLIGQDTIDDLLYRKLEKKLGTVSSMVDGEYHQLNAKEIHKLSKKVEPSESELPSKKAVKQIVEDRQQQQQIVQQISLQIQEIQNKNNPVISCIDEDLDQVSQFLERLSRSKSQMQSNSDLDKNPTLRNVHIAEAQMCNKVAILPNETLILSYEQEAQRLSETPGKERKIIKFRPKLSRQEFKPVHQMDDLDKSFSKSALEKVILNKECTSSSEKKVNFMQIYSKAQQKIDDSRKKN